MKRIICACLCIIMLLGIIPANALQTTFSGIITYDGKEHNYTGTYFSVYVNGNRIETPIPPIVLENGRSIVPVREICEALGAEVLWSQGEDGQASKILIYKGDVLINLTIDSKKATVNGKETTLDTAPKLVAYNGIGKTMIPVRFVSESLNMDVEYQATYRKILIKGNIGSGTVVTPTPTPTPTATPTAKPTVTPTAKPTATPTPTPTPEYVTNLTYSDKNGKDIIDLTFSDQPGKYLVTKLENPNRLVVDFKGFYVDKLKSSYTAGDNIEKIRTGNYDGYARIVFDVEEFPEYTVVINKSAKTARITLTFENSESENSGDDTEEEIAEDAPLVIIDAGHGGSDPGAIGRDENGKTVAYEKDINLAISKKLVELLREQGINAVFTRDEDVYWGLDERTSFANEMEADMFVSIHCNALEDTSVSGTLVMHHTSNAYSKTGAALASNILKYLPSAWGIKDRGRVDGSAMYVIRKANMPSVIVENAFITNEADRLKLTDEALQQKAAEAIAKGIAETLDNM